MEFLVSACEPGLKPKTVLWSKGTSNLIQKSQETELFWLRYVLLGARRPLIFYFLRYFSTERPGCFLFCAFFSCVPELSLTLLFYPTGSTISASIVKMIQGTKLQMSDLHNSKYAKFAIYFVPPSRMYLSPHANYT